MKRALNQWCFPEGTPVSEIFRQSQLAGLDGVELNLADSGGVGCTLTSTPNEIATIKRQAAEFGLKIPSVSTSLSWQWPLSATDVEMKRRAREVVVRQLEVAALLEADTILVVPGLVTKDVDYAECYSRSQTELAELALVAERVGVRIGIENVWNKFLLSPLEMCRFVDELDSAFVGVYFDVGNILQFGFPEQWIRLLASRILSVHVKDFSSQVGNIHGFVPLLSGDVDWLSVREALCEIGYVGYLTAEVTPYRYHSDRHTMDVSAQLSAIIGDL